MGYNNGSSSRPPMIPRNFDGKNLASTHAYLTDGSSGTSLGSTSDVEK